MTSELQPAALVSNPSGALDAHMLVILLIMIAAGLLGGAANYFLAERHEESSANNWLKYSIFGIVAALTVPLFLNMISSTLLEGARTKPVDFFAFGGFCLIYVVASRRLMESVTQLLKGQIDPVKRELSLIKERQQADAAIQLALRQEDASTPPNSAEQPEAREVLSYNDIEILRALAAESCVYGNLAAISERTGLARDFVSQRITIMKSLGVIETRINDKNVLHWGVSTRGKAVLGEVLSAQEQK